MERDLDKCKKVIYSCKTEEQLAVADNMVENFLKKHKKNKDKDSFIIANHELSIAYKKRLYTISNYKNTLEGSQCMVISNEKTPVWKGIVNEFTDFDKLDQMPLPLITDVKENTQYLVMGIVLPYDAELLEKLNSMPYKERWNSVCKPHAQML